MKTLLWLVSSRMTSSMSERIEASESSAALERLKDEEAVEDASECGRDEDVDMDAIGTGVAADTVVIAVTAGGGGGSGLLTGTVGS